MPLMSGSNSVSSLPFKKLHAAGGNYINFQELPQILLSNNQKERASKENHLFGEECPNLSETFLVGPGQDILSHSNAMQLNGFHYENSLFSSSLSETFGKLGLFSSDTHFDKSVDATGSDFVEGEPVESLKEIEAQTIGDLLPNDDELLSGLIGDIERVVHPNNGDEDDLFCSGGGMELESDESLNCSKASDFVCGIPSNCQIGGLNSIYSSELMNAKQTSRTLIVRNVRSNIEEAELKMLFEQFGVIRGLNTANKNRGFILVSYYDIRAARNAVRALQDRLLKQHKIEINYYNPKDNVSEQDRNNATIIISNIDSSVSNGDIHQIFGLYGEIKEIFHDPHFQNQRSIEFYDVRAADAAFSALNMSDISGMKIKVEPGCPGAGWQWNGISSRSSSLGNDVPSGTIAYGVNTSFGLDGGSSRSSSLQTLTNPFMDRKFPGISTTVPHSISSSIRVTMGANQCNQSFDELSHSLGQMNIDFRSTPTFHPHSLPESHNGLISGIPFNAVRAISSKTNINSRIGDGIDSHQNRQGSGYINSHSFEQKEGKVISPIDGHHYIQSNPSTNFHQPPGSFIWQSPTIVNNIPARPLQLHGLPRGPSHMMSPFLPLHHHVGSAPALNPRGRCTTCAGDCMEAPSFYSGSLGNVAFSGSSQMHPFQVASHRMYPHDCRNCIDLSTCAHIGSLSPQQRSHILHGRNSLNSAASLFDAPVERIRSRRSDPSANQVDNKKQFELDINRIICGEDLRTTLMIKNIPNKYTSKMLLATIDEHQKGTYDFIYLPIDFKNKCNVGYAFINMNDPKHIIPFHQAFNGKKWEKFNSEKVASLAYARIQGKTALIAHFQNSSLMNEDKRCRPILFHSDGPKAGDQEAFPMGTHIRSRPGRFKTTSNEDPHQRSPPDSGNMDFPSLSNGTDSSPSFAGEPSFGTT